MFRSPPVPFLNLSGSLRSEGGAGFVSCADLCVTFSSPAAARCAVISSVPAEFRMSVSSYGSSSGDEVESSSALIMVASVYVVTCTCDRALLGVSRSFWLAFIKRAATKG